MAVDDPDPAAIRPFAVTNRLVLAIAVPMTLAYLSTPLLGLTDTAVVGRFGDPGLQGGLAAGAIVFDVVFTTFNFLRAATTGLVAQANGRGDAMQERLVLYRALVVALIAGLAVTLAGPLIAAGGQAFVDPGPRAADAMALYILIRVISAPAALANFVILGYVLGRGEGRTGLALQFLLNGINIALSVWLGLALGWGLEGVAWGTVIGEFVTLAAGLALLSRRFGRHWRVPWVSVLDATALTRLFALSGDIMIRSFALLAAFAWMTRAGAQLGTVTLAANAILLNFFMVAGYFLDGFATAAEQLVGRAVGARFRPAFDRAVKLTLWWGLGLALILLAVFLAGGERLIDVMTTAPQVREMAVDHLFLASLCALTGVVAFQMDGIFIGATWSRDMRNMMLASLALYFASLWALVPAFGNAGLWAALHVFLVARGISLGAILLVRRRQAFQP
ncbi:MATE family efflux transporter [Zhengella sp. ZM62]|uniref:MATE family efflux transporter n=1 Tax=Zhengella sedimenti TaxID=3390035 RepID=UPI0039767D2B